MVPADGRATAGRAAGRARETNPGEQRHGSGTERDEDGDHVVDLAGTEPRTGSEPLTAPTWDEIADRYGSTVYTMAYRLTGDRDEARDLAQDVFVRVYRNLDRYRPGTFEGWLYRITKNLFLDRIRRRSRVTIEPWPDEEWREPSDPDPGPEEQAEGQVLGEPLEDALAQLPPSFRTAVVLCDIQGLTYEEIAAATGWPIGTVRSRIHRGRRLLRSQLDRRGERRRPHG